MTVAKMIGIIVLSALITFFLRAVPFVAFSGDRKMPLALERLGKVLPSALMAILIVYCLKDVSGNYIEVGIPKLFAVLSVGFSYRRRHNTFFSIFLGTAVYMVLLRVMEILV